MLKLHADNLAFDADSRLMLNRMLLEDALGKLITPLVKYRRNGALAVEVLMATSEDVAFDSAQKAKWKSQSLQWLAQKGGSEKNIIAGSDNDDEKTYHLHAIVVPIVATKKKKRPNLIWATFMGYKAELSKAQTDYHEAVKSLGLQRGLKGSKRKHIPQQQLFQHRTQVQNTLESVTATFQNTLDELNAVNPFIWGVSKGKIIEGVQEVMNSAVQSVTEMAELAKEVIPLRRDREEYQRIVSEREKMEKKLAQADKSVATEKQRADQALKDQANAVRDLDLVPIAQEILALEPVFLEGKTVFQDQGSTLKITGRKFNDTQNPACCGSGAIDLVMKLTGNNFKQAVEYLTGRNKKEEIVADQAAGAIEEVQHRYEISFANRNPEPRILTFDDIPLRFRSNNRAEWSKLQKILTDTYRLDPALLDDLNQNGLVWAVNAKTIAFGRTHLDDPNQSVVGVTLMDLAAPTRPLRILAPKQGGYFWLGKPLAETERAVLVANPLEAFNYRRLWDLEPKGVLPQIVSIDEEFPQPALSRHIGQAGKNLLLATNTPLIQGALAAKLPHLLDENGNFVKWFDLEPAPVASPEQSSIAWNAQLIEKILTIQRQKIWRK